MRFSFEAGATIEVEAPDEASAFRIAEHQFERAMVCHHHWSGAAIVVAAGVDPLPNEEGR